MNKQSQNAFEQVVDIVATLRGENGCAWDKAQTLTKLRRCLLEECYETLDAMSHFEKAPTQTHAKAHAEELGDVLLQVLFQSQIQKEAGYFSIDTVCEELAKKLIRRHPHIFGDEKENANTVTAENNPIWERVKALEKAEREEQFASVLEDIPKGLPALMHADKISGKFEKSNFGWPSHKAALAKVEEEFNEMKEAMASDDMAHTRQEIGDLLFTITNLARQLGISAEDALQETNARAKRRFSYVEQCVKATGPDKTLHDFTTAELDKFWQEAKKKEKS
jgi:tetrapyrrole methylase family protein/MazG family protein